MSNNDFGVELNRPVSPTVPEAYVWHSHYPPHVPKHIPNNSESVVDLMIKSMASNWGKPAFSCLGRTIVFEKLFAEASALAEFLSIQLGLAVGDKVGLMTTNCYEHPTCFWATLMAGMTVVNINPHYTAEEMTYLVNDSQAKAVIMTPEQVCKFDMLPGVKKVVIGTTGFQGNTYSLQHAIKLGQTSCFSAPKVNPESAAIFQYTGGTTGTSKGVILSHRNVVANMRIVSSWLNQDVPHTQIVPTPLYHILGLSMYMGVFFGGGHNVIIADSSHGKEYVENTKRYDITGMVGVNTLFKLLLGCDTFKKGNFNCMQYTIGGGAPVEAKTSEDWRRLTGVDITLRYGLSEASPTCMTPLGSLFTGKSGVPLPSTIVRIDNPNERGEGEVVISGPQVTKGYWNKPKANAELFTADGFLKTGDVGVMDERGEVTILGRVKTQITVAGECIHPKKLEETCCKIKGVAEAAAVGLPCKTKGQQVALCLVVKPGHKVTVEQVRWFCVENLAKVNRPHLIFFRRELPKTPVGKIQHVAIKKQLLKELFGDLDEHPT